jgi:dihydrofolate synthase/folylpolyglutamate synthase
MRSSREVFDLFLPFANLERGQAVGVFRLDRMRALCALFGHPESSFKSIHVAGSKGKGSVSAMLASVLDASGRKTGLYTSPHILDYSERISLGPAPMPEGIIIGEGEKIARALGEWEKSPHAELGPPTFFELVTLLAFLCFRAAGCAWAVIETGLGGRLDSTNVIMPEASVLTAIELEHTDYLGNSIVAIAGEKAGIIKPGRPVFCGRMREEALAVMEKKARDESAPFFAAKDIASLEEVRLLPEGTEALLSLKRPVGEPRSLGLRLSLSGSIQAENAALAAMVIDALFPDAADGDLCRGLGRVRLPARFQRLREAPALVVDGSHTPDSVRLCGETWKALYGPGGILVFGCAADKDARGMALALQGLFGRVIVTTPGTFKKSSPLAVFEAFRGSCPSLILEPDTRKALALAESGGDRILVAGSFYLAAEAIRFFTGS